jgi:hypothetical protein
MIVRVFITFDISRWIHAREYSRKT